MNGIGTSAPGASNHAASFAHATETTASGGFPRRRADFFCYFSLSAKEK